MSWPWPLGWRDLNELGWRAYRALFDEHHPDRAKRRKKVVERAGSR